MPRYPQTPSVEGALLQQIGLRVADQRVITALALLARDAPLVSDLRQLSRALVSPAVSVISWPHGQSCSRCPK